MFLFQFNIDKSSTIITYTDTTIILYYMFIKYNNKTMKVISDK